MGLVNNPISSLHSLLIRGSEQYNISYIIHIQYSLTVIIWSSLLTTAAWLLYKHCVCIAVMKQHPPSSSHSVLMLPSPPPLPATDWVLFHLVVKAQQQMTTAGVGCDLLCVWSSCMLFIIFSVTVTVNHLPLWRCDIPAIDGGAQISDFLNNGAVFLTGRNRL